MITISFQNDLKEQKKYRLDIEGLRAISIISVVFFHYHFPFFTGGFVGVDIFFVISGYLITSHLYSEIEKTKNLSFSNFYARRIIRLLPAALTVILVTVLGWFTFLFGIPDETKIFEQSVRYAHFGLANIYFSKNTGGYFDQNSDELPLHHLIKMGNFFNKKISHFYKFTRI